MLLDRPVLLDVPHQPGHGRRLPFGHVPGRCSVPDRGGGPGPCGTDRGRAVRHPGRRPRPRRGQPLAGDVLGRRSRVTSRAPRRSSTVVGEVLSATLNDVELDVTDQPTGGCRCRGWPPTTCWWSPRCRPTPARATRSCAASTPRTSWSTSGRPSSRTGRGAAWACFDQPDLKAVARLQVSAPAEWTVLSNSATRGGARPRRRRAALDLRGHAAALDVRRRGQRRPVPRDPRASAAATTSGCTAASRCGSSSSATPRSCSGVTEQGLAFFGERFDLPFPQERYDQVFVPDFGGAMENWGCVTWTDAVLCRTPADLRAAGVHRARAAARDGAHVVRRPRDHAVVGRPVAQRGVRVVRLRAGRPCPRTEYTDAWAAFLADEQIAGLPAGRGPGQPPDPHHVPDVAHAVRQLRRDHLLQGRRRCCTS